MSDKPKLVILIIATNSYFILGIRFIKRFVKFYRGNCEVSFIFNSNQDPMEFLPSVFSIIWNRVSHDTWQDATNSKFKLMCESSSDYDYLYYFDADTNIDKDFGDWFLGDYVGGEHFSNRDFLKDGISVDRTENVMSSIPIHAPLKYTYYYGAFFGGRTILIHSMCKTLINYQLTDRVIGYEPPVNDESYINKYFYFNPPKLIMCEDFKFLISDKGGIENMRDTKNDINSLLRITKELKNFVFDIRYGKVVNITSF